MKRKLLLLVGTFIILLFGFGVYQLFVPSHGGVFDPRPISRPGRPRNVDGADTGPLREVVIHQRSKDGTIRGVYRVESWTKEDDGSFSLVRPIVCIYHPDGRRTYVRSDSGRIYAEEVAKGINVRHGRLEGNVEIFYDQSKALKRDEPWKRDPKTLSKEVLRIFSNDIYFNHDMLEIHTDSRVSVWSKQVDIVGRGLQLQWNESPRELRKLRLEDGDVLIVKELSDQMDMIQLPVNRKGKASSRPAGSESKTAGTTSSTAGSVKKKKKPTTTPASADERQSRNIYLAKFRRNIRIWSGSRELTGADELDLTFEWDRAWRPGDEDEKPKATSRPASRPRRPASKPASRPASRPAEADGGSNRMEVYWDGPLEIVPTGITQNPNRKRARITGRGAHVVMKDAGARLMCSEFSFENPKQKAVFTAGEDQLTRLRLNPGEEIICRGTIFFDRSKSVGLLDGPGHLVRYDPVLQYRNFPYGFVKDDPRDVTDEIMWKDHVDITFLEQENATGNTRPVIDEAVFHDSVELRRHIPDEKQPASRPASRPASQPARDASSKSDTGPVGVSTTRPASRPAGKQPRDKYDYVNCDTLKIKMGQSKTGRTYPVKAIATGNVKSLQDGTTVTAREVTVSFRPLEDKQNITTAKSETRPASRPVKDKKETDRRGNSAFAMGSGGRVEPENITASGDVKLVRKDPKDPDRPPLEVVADYVSALLNYRPNKDGEPAQLAVLSGKPAILRQGENYIEGDKIYFDEDKEAARVPGPGVLKFVTKQDLSGNALQDARPIKVQWNKSMTYYGAGGYGIFDGDIELTSGGEYMTCSQMRLFFLEDKKEPTKKVAAVKKPATEEKTPKKPLNLKPLSETADAVKTEETKSKKKSDEPKYEIGLNIDRFSSKKMSRLECVGGKGEDELVFMESTTLAPEYDNAVLRRMMLRGEKVLYDAIGGDVYVDGRGRFLSEDYRKPKGKEEAETGDRSDVGQQVQRPSQTVFAWKKMMLLSQTKRYVKLQEDVNMVHRSGKEVLVSPKLKSIPWAWGRLKEGRKTDLRSNVLEAWFAEPLEKSRYEKARDKRKAGQGVSPIEAGSQFGPLKMFSAVRDVTFTDGDGRITRKGSGQRLLFDNVRRLVNLWGFFEGDKNRTNSRIEIQDQKSGQAQTINSPTIIYDMKKEIIKTEKIESR